MGYKARTTSRRSSASSASSATATSGDATATSGSGSGSGPHFTPELFRFLFELKANNDRDWFHANKTRYEGHVKEPMLRFIRDFAPRLKRISGHFTADARPVGGSMFRIYRDVRFSMDKSPYKTVASAHFRHEAASNAYAPGFYLHLEPGSVFMAGGIWHPDSATLRLIRTAIAARPEAWRAVLDDPTFRARCRLAGDALSRPPRGFDPEHPLIEDIKRKDFIAVIDLDDGIACADDFLDRFATDCAAMVPLMGFITSAIGQPF